MSYAPLSKVPDHELRILGTLQTDSSLPNIELAERALAAPSTCVLKDVSVIQREIAILGHRKIVQAISAVIEIRPDRQATEDYDAFE
jgi:DNA-binding Lrp family transcriptional regulator